MVHHTVSHDGNSYAEANHPVLLWHYCQLVSSCTGSWSISRDTGLGVCPVHVWVCEGVRWWRKKRSHCNAPCKLILWWSRFVCRGIECAFKCQYLFAVIVSHHLLFPDQNCGELVSNACPLFYGVTRQLQMSTISMLVGGVHHKAS